MKVLSLISGKLAAEVDHAADFSETCRMKVLSLISGKKRAEGYRCAVAYVVTYGVKAFGNRRVTRAYA